MKKVILLLALTHCATHYDATGNQSSDPLTVRITASMPIPSSCTPKLPIFARLQSDQSDESCELEATTKEGEVSAKGECAMLARKTTISLQYFVKSTNGTQVVIAESVGRADLVHTDTEVVEVFFDSKVSSLGPKSRALITETTAERNRFNCDRTGDNACATQNGLASDAEQDADSCSNLQEVCTGTLFLNSTDTCPQD